MTQDAKQKTDEKNNLFSWVDLTMKPFLEMTGQAGAFPIQDMFSFQNMMSDNLSQAHEKSSGFNKNIFNSFREHNIKHLHKFLNIPQLGLFKFHTEKANSLIDKNIQFQSHLSELLGLFYIPFEKAGLFIQKKVLKEGVNSNSKDNYDIWIAQLEKHFNEVLKSREYTTSLKKVLDSLVCSREARDEVLTLILDRLPIATAKEMDEVYKDLYKTKKELANLSKEIKLHKGMTPDKDAEIKKISQLSKEIKLLRKMHDEKNTEIKKISQLSKEIELLKKMYADKNTEIKKVSQLSKEIELLKKVYADKNTEIKKVSQLSKEIELLKKMYADKNTEIKKVSQLSKEIELLKKMYADKNTEIKKENKLAPTKKTAPALKKK
ncbi:MAG: hypothetical protein GY710_22925 [Desulfobacteraceae bacterium]|nr:hypothetical protein [Desulfobacteraceae bacterium]